MPVVNFDTVDDPEDFSPLPPDTYDCKLIEVEKDKTQYGDEMWNLRFVVEGGEYDGRFIFDRMVFSQKALPRVKLICKRLGLDTSGEIDLTTDKLVDRRCLVTVDIEKYIDAKTGKERKRNTVPFAGYEESPNGAGGVQPSSTVLDDDIPF